MKKNTMILFSLVLFFIVCAGVHLLFSENSPNQERINFETSAAVYIRPDGPEGNARDDILLSADESNTIITALNACAFWSSYTCACTDGIVMGAGGAWVRWAGDHFHYVGRDLVTQIPKEFHQPLEDLLQPYLTE